MATAFRTVLRGYEPAQVDAEVATLGQALNAARAELGELTVQLKEAGQRQAELQATNEAANARAEEAARARTMASRPTFADLGERIGQILTLAEDEAAELKRSAQEEGARLVEDATKRATQMVSEADRYAVDTRSSAEADAEARLAGAQRRADELIDHADREAAARREEAEAVYEHQRARAAQAAADFEKTLADRRDKAAADFAAQMSAHEAAVARAEEQLAAIGVEAERTRSDADAQAQALLSGAREEATGLVEQAKAAAERIRRESDRELQAATSRRDAITAQLTNVRQMLATLGGSSLADVLAEPSPAPAAPAAAAEPAVEATTVDLAKAESTAVEDEDEDGKPEA